MSHDIIQGVPRSEPGWLEQFQLQNGYPELYNRKAVLIGDSMAFRWPQDLKWPGLDQTPAKFAIGGDRAENVLWRLEHIGGRLDRANFVMIFAGTNNVTTETDAVAISSCLFKIVKCVRSLSKNSLIILSSILYRGENLNFRRPFIDNINGILRKKSSELDFLFLDVNGTIDKEVGGSLSFHLYSDYVHLSSEGYKVLASMIGRLV
ncbi:MAG TPA: GDSL-type esterase/lipase family protein [Stellaceae bacterium]|jgi:lysophospholipase L1-like esterase|nr:GDSL-type esterase/lipase family protein [Stellaceae bacterium]